LHKAAPYALLDEVYPPAPIFSAFQKILTDAQALVSLLQPSKIHLLTLALQGAENQALGIAVDWKIANTIHEAGGSIDLAALADKYKTDKHKIGSEICYDLLTNRMHYARPRKSTCFH